MKVENLKIFIKIIIVIQTLFVQNYCEAKSKSKKVHKAVPRYLKRATRFAPIANVTGMLQQTIFKPNNNSLARIVSRDLKENFVTRSLPQFNSENRNWIDNKLYRFQVDEIFKDFNIGQQKEFTPTGLRAAFQIFLKEFKQCDINYDNLLSFDEFMLCTQTSSYFKDLKPAFYLKFNNYANFTFTNSTGFYAGLYSIFKNFHFKYINFYDYMSLRLMIFSWSKCSVFGPFLDEVSFTCALKIVTGWRALSSTTSRRLYYTALEFSNNKFRRKVDFLTFSRIALSSRLFGRINGKEDHDATKMEFTLALDKELIPIRYNQDIIDQMFRLVEERDKPNQGIDIISFVYYDLALQFFVQPDNHRRWYMDIDEFQLLFQNFLFPSGIIEAIKMIPQINFSYKAYEMFTYQNISQYNQEGDFFLKFTQKNEKKMEKNLVNNKNQMNIQAKEIYGNSTSDINSIIQWVFSIIDCNSDGFINFYDFGSFYQIAYLFNKFDEYSKGKIVAGTLFEKYSEYSDLPTISYILRERAARFNLLPQDLYIDLLRVILVLRVDDIIKTTVRKSDPSTLYEIELKNILKNVNLEFIPASYLNKCLRGTDNFNVPKYDWECAFIQSITVTAQVLESMHFYHLVQDKQINLVNTVFVNHDPNI